jgi:hypothetical protein
MPEARRLRRSQRPEQRLVFSDFSVEDRLPRRDTMPMGVQLEIDPSSRQLTGLGQGHQMQHATAQDVVVVHAEARRQPREQRVLIAPAPLRLDESPA